MVGHYGTPALIAGGVAALALVLHLAVPFAVLDLPEAQNSLGFDDEAQSRKDVTEALDDGPDVYGLAAPGLTLAGIILALVAGIAAIALGFVPMPVAVARFVGWGTGLVGAMGAWFMTTSSLFPMGKGFATLLGLISGSEGARLWVVSPVLVAACGGALLWAFLRIIRNVITRKDDLRDGAARILRAPVLAAVFLAIVLIAPWAVLVQDGNERRASGDCLPSEDCPGQVGWHTAWGDSESTAFGGILATSEVTGGDLWGHLAFGLKVMNAAAWVTFFAAVVATLGHVISSVAPTQVPARVFGGLQLANLVTLPWATVQLLLATIYQWKPSWDDTALTADQSWWFAFFPLFAFAPLALWILHQLRANLATFQGARTFVARQQEQTHSFD